MLLCEMNARATQHKYWSSMLCNEASRTVAKRNIALPLLLRFFDPLLLYVGSTKLQHDPAFSIVSFPYSSYLRLCSLRLVLLEDIQHSECCFGRESRYR